MTTNLELHRALLADAEFAAGGVDTGYLARWLAGAGTRRRGLARGAGSAGRGDGGYPPPFWIMRDVARPEGGADG